MIQQLGDLMDFDAELIRQYELFCIILAKTISGYTPDEFKEARNEYLGLRTYILSKDGLRSKMLFILNYQTLDEFSIFIKTKGSKTADRRAYIKKMLSPANAFIYHISATPGDEGISETLSHSEHLIDTWEKALQRIATDSDGAITSARTLLETTFKYVLDEKGLKTSYDSNTKLMDLCFKASTEIAIHPQSTTDDS